ncbi:MAG: hypothetical protein JWN91_4019 [Nocardioides sp.]|jgi:RND superfamily putative drug exporter|nr:hypothetical protein [Nocardioides sp.]
MSADGDTALFTVTYDVPVTDPDLVGKHGYDPLVDAIEPLRDQGLDAELGGELPGGAGSEMKGSGELAGVIAALALLVIAFGSVVAAGSLTRRPRRSRSPSGSSRPTTGNGSRRSTSRAT